MSRKHKHNRRNKHFCKIHLIKSWVTNKDGRIDVIGDVNLRYVGNQHISVEFGHVSGDFNCSFTSVYTIFGFPLSLGGKFMCLYTSIAQTEANFAIMYERYDQTKLLLCAPISTQYDRYYKARYRLEVINKILI